MPVLLRMHPTTTFDRRNAIGIQWECYGFARRDTIGVELRIEREDSPGMLSRAAATVGLRRIDQKRDYEVA